MSDIANEDDAQGRQSARRNMRALPSSMLAKEFGKVYVSDDGSDRNVEFTVWVQHLSGANAEGWKTAVALDASSSMNDWYGRSVLAGGIPQQVLDSYTSRGWTEQKMVDGANVLSLRGDAHDDALKQGFIKYTDNIVEPLARDFIAYLANELDGGGRAAALYWACGEGDSYEVIGEFTPEECKTLDISGPKTVAFGNNTHLLPALSYFCDEYQASVNSMFVFITDGRLDDIDEVKQFTSELAKKIESGQRNPVKCVLIGVGDQIDEAQMEDLDDLETGTDVDIWDHKIAKELRALSEIMVELVEDVGSSLSAKIYDDQGNLVKKISDGLQSSEAFTMPGSSKFFELEIGGQRIRQSVEISS